jgi:uncharacterized protein with HEPN domain
LPSDRPILRFEDIIDNIERIEQYTTGLTFQEFQHDRQCRDAVERCLLRIAEAANKLTGLAEEMAPDQPWSSIRAVGNVLRHEYDEVDPATIWEIVTNHLRPLREAVAAIIAILRRNS